MIKDLFFDTLNITEQTAIACTKIIGNKDQYQADFIAVQEMRKLLNKCNIQGTIVIGEGERDQAPMLFIGENVGLGGISVDIAVDPLEGTKLCAYNQRGAMSVIAIGDHGTLLNAPDVYMDKIAVGPATPLGVVDLDDTVENNLANLANFHKKDISDLKVIVLNRPRHKELISRIRKCNAKLKLISDGDVTAVISTSFGANRTDLYIGSGGAPEGVLAAAALKTLGGQIMGRLIFENDQQILRAKTMGLINPTKTLYTCDMVKGNVIFAATAITNSDFLKGIKYTGKNITTETFMTCSNNQQVIIAKREHYE